MSVATDARLMFGTLRYLKPVQVAGRLHFRLQRPSPDLNPPPGLRETTGRWVSPARRQQSLFGPAAFRFLNRDGDLSSGWDDPAFDKLWRYNLHYFDDLNAVDADARQEWHRAIILRWIEENRPGEGTGWEPYPTSLRIVNWIKWALAGHVVPGRARHSLAVQARWLMRRLEVHLQGNHLLANAKALIFAGLFFDGAEAVGWLDRGLAILAEQIEEQILPDGGHFELSPMYHALVLEDALDLLNAANTWPQPLRDRKAITALQERIPAMRRWLAAMCHPDGEIAFFNDAAMGVAPSPAELASYARWLGLERPAPEFAARTILATSGYTRVSAGPAVAILDVGRVGPDYLLGHAHADTLSFEASLAGRRFLVNSGTSLYETGPERQRQRGTRAHNTVTIGEADSSEVWAAFRVAGRARPLDLEHGVDGPALWVTCSHNGYRRLRGHPVHRRTWHMTASGLSVVDAVSGGVRDAEARFHFHPDVAVTLARSGTVGVATLAGLLPVRLHIEPEGRLEAATWHPEFGMTRLAQCLVVPLREGRSSVTLRWSPER